MSINGRRPFQEIVECCQNELVREAASNQEDKYKGLVNQVYLNDLPSVLSEEYIKKEAYITLAAEYTTGTVTVGSGTTNVKGDTTSWTSAHNNFLLKVNGFNRIQRMTYAADTSLTFQNSQTWVEASGTGLSYHLFQDRYALPSDFGYMISDDPDEPQVVSRFVSGANIFLSPKDSEEFDKQFSGVIGDVWAYAVKWISEQPYLMVLSAPGTADILKYSYIPQLTTLIEYTAGTVTFTTGTAVVGAGMAWTANINTAVNQYYIRNDADGTGSSSKWQKILSIANATALTLEAVWGGTSGTGITYTISEVSKWPARFDDAILYKTALIADPDNLQSQKWLGLYSDAISLDKKVDSRRMTTRPLKQFFGLRGK